MPILGRLVSEQDVVEAVRWQRLGVTWTSADGRTSFDLTDIGGGVLLKRGGVIGLNMPPYTRYSDQGPAVAGSRNRGSNVNERPVFWPIFLWSDATSQEFLDRDATFWRTLFETIDGDPGTWTVTQPSGEARRLACRYVDDGSQAADMDPVLYGWAIYGIDLVAEQPFWVGDTITRTFEPPDPVDFFAASGDVFNISPGDTTDSAFIPNPGHVESWPIWTAIGSFASANLGAGDGSVGVPFALASGKSLTVDTHPDNQIAIDSDGVDRSGDVDWDPRPIPAGAEVELDVSLTSPGTGAAIKVTLDPLYYRAWG